MKKWAALLSALTLLFLCCGSEAAGGTFATTRSFLSVLDRENIAYDPPEVTSAGDEELVLGYTGDTASFNIHLYFSSSLDTTLIQVRQVTTFNPSETASILESCNIYNRDHLYVKVYADTDNTVTAEMVVIYDSVNCGSLVYDALWTLINEVESRLNPFFNGTNPSGSTVNQSLTGSWTSYDIGSMIGELAGSLADLDGLGDLVSGTVTFTFALDGTYTISINASVFGIAQKPQSESGTWTAADGVLRLTTTGSLFGSASLQYSVSGDSLYLQDSSGMSLFLTR